MQKGMKVNFTDIKTGEQIHGEIIKTRHKKTGEFALIQGPDKKYFRKIETLKNDEDSNTDVQKKSPDKKHVSELLAKDRRKTGRN